MELKGSLGFLLLGVLLTACAPPLAPAPTLPQIALQTPTSLTLTGGTATAANDVLLNLAVTDSAGRGVPGETVFLTTTAGLLNHASVVTGPTGTAQVMLNTTRTATVTAMVRSLIATAKALPFALALNVSARATPTTLNKGDGVTLSATVTNGTAPFTYAWTFGDGSTGSGQTTSHRYFSDGQKTIGLTVTDADERTGLTSTSVTVQSDPEPAPPPAPPAGSTLAVAVSCTPTGHAPVTTPCNVTTTYGGAPVLATEITDVDWDWGDGTQTLNQTDPVEAHPYAQAGTYTVVVTVTATTADGSKSGTASKTIMVP